MWVSFITVRDRSSASAAYVSKAHRHAAIYRELRVAVFAAPYRPDLVQVEYG
jgi:hypothetical protein